MKPFYRVYLPLMLLSMLCASSITQAFQVTHEVPDLKFSRTYFQNTTHENSALKSFSIDKPSHLKQIYVGDICNCNFLDLEHYLHITPSYQSGINPITVRLNFLDQKIVTHWSLETVRVPEPTNYLFLLSGLGVILLVRLRRKVPH